jgi:hypothetical protein
MSMYLTSRTCINDVSHEHGKGHGTEQCVCFGLQPSMSVHLLSSNIDRGNKNFALNSFVVVCFVISHGLQQFNVVFKWPMMLNI